MAELGLAPWCADESRICGDRRGGGGGAGLCRSLCRSDGEGRGRSSASIPSWPQAVAVQTLVGTGALAAATGESMADIARRVASPKGTTEQGLAVLDAPDGLQPLVDRMLAAAIRRAEELAAEAAGRN